MSTHNIGFYADLTKIIFQLSSNIIKYAPYRFFWDGPTCFRHKVKLNLVFMPIFVTTKFDKTASNGF